MAKWLKWCMLVGLGVWVASAFSMISAMSAYQQVNLMQTDPTPPPGGRADLARELIELELYGPLQELFRDDRFEFVFSYAEGWEVNILDTEEVVATFEDTVVTFSGQAFFQLNSLASLPTLEDLIDDVMWRMGDYEPGKLTIFKANGRPALEIEGFAPDGSELIFVGVTFSDGRFGLATVQTDDEFLLQDVVYLMLDSFDIAPIDAGPVDQLYLARDLSYTLLYPAEWTVEDVPQGGYVAISNGDIAINVYGPAGVQLQGVDVNPGDVMALADAIIALIAWEAEPPQRLRLDNRPVARLIYDNPVFAVQGRLYTMVLDNETRALGYFDVVPLSAASSVVLYEQTIFDMLESFKAPEF